MERADLLKIEQQCACVTIKAEHLPKCCTVHIFTPYQAQVVGRCTSTECGFLLPLLIQCRVRDIKQLPQRAFAAPRDHRQLHLFWQLSLTLRVCSAVGCHLPAEPCSTKEPNLYSTRKRNYKTHVPGERVSAWHLLPKMWKTTATSVLPCTSTPQASDGCSLPGIRLRTPRPRSSSTTPAH